jgi:formylglycine-generating enzyme required for sulfatase activity
VRETIGGADMMLAPPGCFLMGSDRGEDDEEPVHVQCFDEPFWIDRYEVSNAAYGSPGYFSARALPRESITWFEARDYCAGRGARLLSEVEWEFAARGPYSLIYPWGNEFIDANAVSSWQVTARETEPVDSRPDGVSWVGAYNMSGNVWEWTSSLYGPYPFDAEDGRQEQEDEFSPRVVRGGACCSYVIADVRAAYRFALDPYTIDPNVGVRCALSYQDGLRQLAEGDAG